MVYIHIYIFFLLEIISTCSKPMFLTFLNLLRTIFLNILVVGSESDNRVITLWLAGFRSRPVLGRLRLREFFFTEPAPATAPASAPAPAPAPAPEDIAFWHIF